MLPAPDGFLASPVTRCVFEVTSDALFLCRLDDGAVLEVNPAASRLVGAPASDLTRRTLSDLLPGSQGRRRRSQFARLVRADGGSRPVVWRLLPLVGTAGVGLVLIRPAAEANTSRENREPGLDAQQLVEWQRLEGLALLIGNVTHSFNNLLTGILGYTVLAQRELSAGDAVQNYLEQIEQGGQQAGRTLSPVTGLPARDAAASMVTSCNCWSMRDAALAGRNGRAAARIPVGGPDLRRFRAMPVGSARRYYSTLSSLPLRRQHGGDPDHGPRSA